MQRIPPKKAGISRVLAAFNYSLNGLRYALSAEAAFRQELCIALVAAVGIFFLPLSLLWKGMLFVATAAVLVIELLNSAIESIVDLVSPEYHVLAKRAKDLGSAAVFVSLVFASVLWACALFTMFRGAPN